MESISSEKPFRIFDYSPIDWFVANSILDAAELNVSVDKGFKTECNPIGEKRDVFIKYINENGEPLAYLSKMVSESFRTGLSSNRIAPYLRSRRERMDILHIIEQARHEIDRKEANLNVTVPILQDAADMLLISMSVYAPLMTQFRRDHSQRELSYKARKYYGQASIDLKRKGQAGASNALGSLSDNFEGYLFVMKLFAKDFLNQDIAN